MLKLPENIFICPFCGHLSKMVWVHGHGQCQVCGNTIDECCRGEQAAPGEKDFRETQKDKKNITPDNTQQDAKDHD